jgi:hypothetical protein
VIAARPRQFAGTALAERTAVDHRRAGVRLLLALTPLAWGCGTGSYHVPYHKGHSANPTAGDFAFLAADVAFGALDRRAPAETTREHHPWDSPSSARPAPPPSFSPPSLSPARRLFGKVTWESGERVPFVLVTLRGSSDSAAVETRTDINGRFWLPWPLPAGSYRLSVDSRDATGETEVRVQDGPPDNHNVVVRAR